MQVTDVMMDLGVEKKKHGNEARCQCSLLGVMKRHAS